MTTDAVGGVWTYARDLARGLARHGVETVLAVLGPNQGGPATSLPGLTLRPLDLPLDWTAATSDEVRAAGAAVSALAAEEGVDLVHLNSPAMAAAIRFDRPVIGVCHSCVATWWQAVHGAGVPMPPDLAWRAELAAAGCAATDALVAPSAAFARVSTRMLNLSRLPIVVHNGRWPAGLAPEAAGADADIVFTAGRLWDEGKNIAGLDRAAGRMRVPVLAAGPTDGPNGAHVSLRHVQALGRLDPEAVAGWLARRPVFASLARYEPFGLAVLEAAQAGCALLLSDIPTFRELWHGAALFVPPEAGEARVAAALEGLVHSGERRLALGEAARERARRYGAEAMTQGMLRIYADTLAASGRRGVRAA